MTLFRFLLRRRRPRRPPVDILPATSSRERRFDRQSRLYLFALLMQRP